MSDHELLKLAAKAAGVTCHWAPTKPDYDTNEGQQPIYWNPLADDGEALRLAVALGLVVDCSRPSAGAPYTQHAFWLDDTMSTAELTRRAIVRAAADLGATSHA